MLFLRRFKLLFVKKIPVSLAILFFIIAAPRTYAQNETDERALLHIKNGISISKDSLFKLNLRFRMQNRFGMNTESGENLTPKDFDARVRRLRLRFDGYVLNPKMQYYIQLSFSRADQDLENGVIAQTVRDAILYYHFNKKVYIGFGQSKLPGNRQRVISSGNQQFADRSQANTHFTLDRDFGFFGYYALPAGQSLINFKAAITTGDGRNASPINNGLAYTGRLEWLPFGKFINNGDFSEGDLEFEPTPKVSIAAGYSFNNKAARTGGQLGNDLYQYRDIRTFIADVLVKYRGLAISAEYFDRTSPDPITTNTLGNVRYVYAGQGLNAQVSQMITKKTEIVTRYTLVKPYREIALYETRSEDLLLGLNHYLNQHRIKVQGNIGYRWRGANLELPHTGNRWSAVFQVEFGI